MIPINIFSKMFYHSFSSLTTNTAQQMTQKLVPFNLWKAAIQMDSSLCCWFFRASMWDGKKMLLVPTHRFSAKTCSVKSKLNLANLYLNKT